MPLRFLERTSLADHAKSLSLATYTPELPITGLVAGVDNVRHDVYLSPKFSELTRAHISDLIEKHGAVEDLVKEDSHLGINTGETGRFLAAFDSRTAPRT